MAVKFSRKTKKQLKKTICRVKLVRPISKQRRPTRSRSSRSTLLFSYTERTAPHIPVGSTASARSVLKKVTQDKVPVVFKCVPCRARSLWAFNRTFRARLVTHLHRPKTWRFSTKPPAERFLVREGKCKRFYYTNGVGLLAISRRPKAYIVWKLRRYALTAVVVSAAGTLLAQNPYVRAFRRRRRQDAVPLDFPVSLFRSPQFFRFVAVISPVRPKGLPAESEDAILLFVERLILEFEKYKVECDAAFLRNEPAPLRIHNERETRALVGRIFAWFLTRCDLEMRQHLMNIRKYALRGIPGSETRKHLRLYSPETCRDFPKYYFREMYWRASARRLLSFLRRGRFRLVSKAPSVLFVRASTQRARRVVWRTISRQESRFMRERNQLLARKRLLYAVSDIILRRQWASLYAPQAHRKRMIGNKMIDEGNIRNAFHPLVLLALTIPCTPYVGPHKPTPEELAAEEAILFHEDYLKKATIYTDALDDYERAYPATVKFVVGTGGCVLDRYPSDVPVFSLWLICVLAPDTYEAFYDEDFDFEDAEHEDQIDVEDYDTDYRGFNEALFTRSPLQGWFRACCLDTETKTELFPAPFTPLSVFFSDYAPSDQEDYPSWGGYLIATTIHVPPLPKTRRRRRSPSKLTEPKSRKSKKLL